MEIEEILMYTVVITVCVAPVVWFARNASSKSRLILKSLKKVTGKLPAQHEVWTGRGIAYDNLSHRIIYVNIDQAEIGTEVIPIDEIIDVNVLVNSRKIPDTKKTIDPKDVDSIELQLICSSRNKPEYRLRFFDTKTDGPFHANIDFQVARKWRKKISEIPVPHHA